MNETVTPVNFQTLASWAGILILVIGAVATPIIRSLLRENDRLAKDLADLEDRVQQRAQLALEPVKQALETTGKTALEKRAEDVRRIERLENILLDQVLKVQTK